MHSRSLRILLGRTASRFVHDIRFATSISKSVTSQSLPRHPDPGPGPAGPLDASRATAQLKKNCTNAEVEHAVTDSVDIKCEVDKQRLNFYSVPHEDLVRQLQMWGFPSFHAGQIRGWVFAKGVTSFMDMPDLPKQLRSKLAEQYTIGSLQTVYELTSKDGTIKRAYELADKQIIESVLMPYDDGRFTACISSQVGCAMGCTFCATGQMGFSRQLSADEIFEQVQRFSAMLRSGKNEREGEQQTQGKAVTGGASGASGSKRLSNVVFMGMGEPLANYKNTMTAVRRIVTELGIGARHITISTAGIAPRIRKLAEEDVQVGLAVSLHQTKDAARSALMPVNNRYPIAELLDACKYYIQRTNRRITFEWALIAGQTDSEKTAHDLGLLLRGMLCHVNVIPINVTKGFVGKPTLKADVDIFCKIVRGYGVSCTPRTRRGIDIEAGCGQLRADLLKERKERREVPTPISQSV